MHSSPASARAFHWFLSSIDPVEAGRNKEHSRCDLDRQPSYESACQRGIGFATFSEFQRHRQQSDDRCQRGHQNGPQSHAAGFDDSFGDPCLSPRRCGANSTIKRSPSSAIRSVYFADRSFLRIAVINLLDNAVKYSPSGSAIRLKLSSTDGPEVKLLQCIWPSRMNVLEFLKTRHLVHLIASIEIASIESTRDGQATPEVVADSA